MGLGGRNERAGSTLTPSLSALIPSSQGSRLSELWGPQARPPLRLPAFTLAVSAPRKACSATLQSPTQPEAPLDVFPQSACVCPAPPRPHHSPSFHGPTVHTGPASPERRACPSEPWADLWGGGGRGSHTQAFRLLPGDSCALDTALSMGKGTNKTDTTPVLRELTPQEDLRPTDQPCWAEGRAKTPSVAHEGTERDGHWPRRE